MLFDLGLEPEQMDNEIMVKMKIEEIETQFKLVMIAEHFSESLVLLKNGLCWDIYDVTNFHLNGRKDEMKSQLTNKTRSLLKEYLNSDYMLYDHFHQIFQSKMETFGKTELSIEVSDLEQANKDIYDNCSVTAADNALLQGDDKWWGPNLIGYTAQNTLNEECQLMTMSELKFIDRIRTNQAEKAALVLENISIPDLRKYTL